MRARRRHHGTRPRDVALDRHTLLARARSLGDTAAAQRRRHDGWTAPLVMAGGWDALRAVSEADPEAVAAAVSADLATVAVPRAGVGPDLPLDPDARQGWLHTVRGAAGELETLDRIGTGQVGVPTGVDQVELLPFTAPGADLVLTGQSGTVMANVKMTATADPLARHLSRHPDVPLVYASTEAAADAARRGMPVARPGHLPLSGPAVIDTGISIADLDADILGLAGPRHAVADAPRAADMVVDAVAEGPLDGLWDLGSFVSELASPAISVLPIGTVLVVGVRAALRRDATARRQVTRQRAQVRRAQLLRAASSTAAAKGVTALSSEPTLGLVAAVTTSIALGGVPGARATWRSASDREREVRAWAGDR